MSRMNSTGENEAGVNQVKDKAAELSQDIRNIGSQVRDAAREQYGQVRDQATEYYEKGRQKAQQLENDLESYIQEKPLKALLIAAGVGLVVGALWRRR